MIQPSNAEQRDSTPAEARTASRPAAAREHRWIVLAIIGIAQLMVVLDTTIVNIALPSAQRALGFTVDSRQWIITAYALAFGSLLLLGGRLSDLLGRRLTLMVGLLGFAGASALGGASGSFGMLVSARTLQGMFAAILAPAALSTLNVTFPAGKERGRAFGVYAAIAGGGAAIGLIVGGMLTDWLSWRWCLYVNLLFAIPAAVGVLIYLHAKDDSHGKVKFDVAGVLAGSGGLFCLVYGLSNAAQHGWGATLTIAMLVASGLLLAGFVVIEAVVSEPLLPLRIVADRNRGGSYLAICLAFVSMFGTFLFLTYYLQDGLRYSPLRTGVAFLPLAAGIVISAGLANTRMMPKVGPRPLVPAGMLIASGGMAWLAQLSISSSYASAVLGPIIVLGLGLGLIIAPSINTATTGIEQADAGVGSAMVNTSQQIGGAVGTAVLSTIFATALTGYLKSHAPSPVLPFAAAVHADSVAFLVCAGVFLAGGLISGLLLRSGRIDQPQPRVAKLARPGHASCVNAHGCGAVRDRNGDRGALSGLERRKRSEEPSDPLDATVRGKFREVHPLKRDLIAAAQHPCPAEAGPVAVDAARKVDRMTGEHGVESSYVRDQRGAAVGRSLRILVEAVVGPRSLKQRGALRFVWLIPCGAIAGHDVAVVHWFFPGRDSLAAMRRIAQVVGVVILLLGVFWVGRESGHGVSALWEHWWCPTPLVLILLGFGTVLASRRSSRRSSPSA
jgi:EmrB/QacA subfamily drug resistance transporter